MSSPAPYRKLHPGPGTPREEVVANQRARLYAAMVELVSERGFGAVTVAELTRRAGVSKHTFYERFADKETCFLCVYDVIVRHAARRVGAAQRDCRDDWRQGLELAFCAFAGEIESEPRAARLALVEAFAGGPAALERMRQAEELFAGMIEQSFAGAPDHVPVPPLIVRGIVAGVHRVARAQLLAGRAHELAGMAEELLEWALCLRCEEAVELGRLAVSPAPVAPGAATPATHDRGVREDDRERILDAVARLAAQEGYWQLTVPRIRAVAGVSRKRFDEQFEGVQGCFIAALEHHTGRVLTYAAPAGARGRGWPGGLHRALHALCAYIAADPVFARLGFIEVFAPGPDGMLCRERLIAQVAESFRASAPAAQRPSELASEASVGAIWGIVHRYIASGQAHRLARITPVLSFLALAPAIGSEQAVRAIMAEHALMREGAGPRDALAASAGGGRRSSWRDRSRGS